jgi:hypothetical protein
MEHMVSRFASFAAGFSMVLVAGACCLATDPVSYGTQIAMAEVPDAPFYEPGTARVLTTETTSWDMSPSLSDGKLCYSHHEGRLIWVGRWEEQYRCAREPQ